MSFQEIPMATQTTTDLSYPIGRWQYTPGYTAAQRAQMIEQIAAAPAQLRAAVAGLSAAQLDTPYRPGGWTVRQLVHHVPESHMNAYIRFKWALTEDDPKIKAYEQADWARTAEVFTAPPEVSLNLLEALHAKWVLLLKSLSDSDWQRTIQHPESGEMALEKMLAIYSWHGRHHAAHITELRKRNGW
jgi:hypothetical protein